MNNNEFVNQNSKINTSTSIQPDLNQHINQYQQLNNPYINQYPQIDIAIQSPKKNIDSLKVNKVIIPVISGIALLIGLIGIFTPVLSKNIKNVGIYKFSSGVAIQAYENSVVTILTLLLTISITILSIISLILTIIDKKSKDKVSNIIKSSFLLTLSIFLLISVITFMAFNPNLELPTDSKFSDLLVIVDGMASNKQASAQYMTILYALIVTSIFSLANLFKKQNNS